MRARGIILAGGTGSRLFPTTFSVSKQLLNVYDRPLIFFPLFTLMKMGIRDIDLICTPTNYDAFNALINELKYIGINIDIYIQDKPAGLPDAFNVVEPKYKFDLNILILGDNIFYDDGLDENFISRYELKNQATIFSVKSKNPEYYGVPIYNDTSNLIDFAEKPSNPKSNDIIPGLYFYTNEVFDNVKKLQPSKRGELEITDLNRNYLFDGSLELVKLHKNSVWFDTGNPDSLLDASNFISSLQKSLGTPVMNPYLYAYEKELSDRKNILEVLISNKNSSFFAEVLESIDS